MFQRWAMIWVCLTISISTTLTVRADETDQFTLPPRDSFADLGPFFSAAHYHAFERVVTRLNRKIDQHASIADPARRAARLKTWHEPLTIANMVRHEFGPALTEMRSLEGTLNADELLAMYPDQRTRYRTSNWIYDHVHLPIDPRKFMLLFIASTVNINGHFIGLDKVGHFHDLGHIYYKDYVALRNRGKTDEQATAIVVRRFSRGAISEAVIIGTIASGVQSNGDLASNYIGFKFYRNLTETVRMGDRSLPPMFVRVGDYWALNTHVRPDHNFFKPFVTDHWNEALNPNIYEWSMRGLIRRHLRKRADQIQDFYAHPDGTRRTAEEFRQIEQDLSTFYGEDYGYLRAAERKMVTIANACFPDDTTNTTTATATATNTDTDTAMSHKSRTDPVPLTGTGINLETNTETNAEANANAERTDDRQSITAEPDDAPDQQATDQPIANKPMDDQQALLQ